MASRVCPQCGQEAPQTARFCSQCSASFFGDPQRPVPTQPFDQNKLKSAADNSKIALIVSAGAAVVVLLGVAIFVYARSTSVVHATPPVTSPASPIVQAANPAPTAPPVVQASDASATAPPVTQAGDATPTPPPQAIVDYLAYVQRAEAYRANLEANQTASLLPLLGTAQGMQNNAADDNGTANQAAGNQINQGMTQNLQKWQALVQAFQSQTPPTGCEDLANSYYKFLSDYTDLCSQIQAAIANGDYAKVMTLQTAQTQVDQDAATADGALADICSKYGIKKQFAISTDSGSGGTSLLGG